MCYQRLLRYFGCSTSWFMSFSLIGMTKPTAPQCPSDWAPVVFAEKKGWVRGIRFYLCKWEATELTLKLSVVPASSILDGTVFWFFLSCPSTAYDIRSPPDIACRHKSIKLVTSQGKVTEEGYVWCREDNIQARQSQKRLDMWPNLFALIIFFPVAKGRSKGLFALWSQRDKSPS